MERLFSMLNLTEEGKLDLIRWTLKTHLHKASNINAIPAPVPAGRGGGRRCCEDAPLVAAVSSVASVAAGAVEDVRAGVDDGRGRPRVAVPHDRVKGGPRAQDPHRLDLVDLEQFWMSISIIY